MKFYLHIYLVVVVILLASCKATEISSKSQPHTTQAISSQKIVTLDKNFKIAMGQTIYVPVYSHIYHHNRQEIFNLAATLSIRNTDLANPLIITSVRYYDSDGKLVKNYLEQPIQLDALASTDFFINRNNTSGGLGANFIVEWVASTEISEPIVEAIMIGTDFQQGISFTSSGKVIKSQN
ncbi:DUF3124 domain-containing protein [Anabaena cylindrica FACHB-243]|uniref:DUF3124 domain-containing protein n=1 Tax=Anabaena cylindrica (strain ATCC 27899 / PCC 7122) TaxID=272123 RepID=K9ZN80_ANACC|nr:MULTISPECIES: DUF3124 domain-containing protein [Anabaena]AFZ59770.1 hypothetical protein Anacy_4410 [Anabaena cylindrica PCC 7122]MBD2417174.1 DUF3124 domain-containing protein [Anabaena cylindrica FACHB-243]MBY5282258.1 DUF3124 domain-containing protein [Anabaena sp. CCAP 1446/1C]MBY5309411.1 DUF3124 domain-containing protein [Anabaena sp. CCAP 1446/1C]MCM2405010.1 DUF3124 domain-containing protein [Anabaena sp. CCAP 1446/1C]